MPFQVAEQSWALALTALDWLVSKRGLVNSTHFKSPTASSMQVEQENNNC